MKKVGKILSILISLCLLAGCGEAGRRGGDIGKELDPTGGNGIRPTFADVTEGDRRLRKPGEPITDEGLLGATLEYMVRSAAAYHTITEQFSADDFDSYYLKEYTSENAVKAPLVFVTVELDVQAIRESEEFKDCFYLDSLRVVDLNQPQSTEESDLAQQHIGFLMYRATPDGDIRLKEEINRCYLNEGQSGRLVTGYFIKEESLTSDKLYLAVGNSKDECAYVPLRELIGEVAP